MDFNEYQRLALRSAPAGYEQHHRIITYSLGLTGESGEVADLVKKWHGQGHALDKEKVAKELGDVLWYIATLADALGWPLELVADANVQKLLARYPDGFEAERSVNRQEETPEG